MGKKPGRANQNSGIFGLLSLDTDAHSGYTHRRSGERKVLDKPPCVCYPVRNLLMPLSEDEKKRLVTDLRLYGNLGIEMAASVLIGAFIGRLLDRWLHTEPWILILGFTFGAAAGFRSLYRFISRENHHEGKPR